MQSFKFFALPRLTVLRFVAIALLMASVGAGALQPAAADAPASRPAWDDTVAAIMAPAAQAAAQGAASHVPHLGWDKAAGTRLADVTAQLAAPSSAARAELAGAKASAFSAGQLVFRSGYTVAGAAGLQASWLSQAASAAADAPAYGVIQFPLPFDTGARQELEKAGVKFYNYVDGGGLYARVPAGAISRLQTLANAGRVLQAGAIPAAARLDPALASAPPETRLPIVVQFFDPPSPVQLTQVGQYMQVEADNLHPALPLLQGTARAADAATLAALPYVRWVEMSEQAAPSNFESTMLFATDILRAMDPLGSTGEGVRIGVMDTGIMQSPYHDDLPADRILDQFDFFPGNDAIADDTSAHGTHVAGTIAGNGSASGADLGLQGHAPGAELLIYKLCCSGGFGYFSAHFQSALIRGAEHGMNVSNNSWGGGNGIYTTNSEIADRAVRGEYGKYTVMVVAAGNDNQLVSSPGTGKNVITVGAVKSGNYRNVVLTGCGDTNWAPAERVCFSNYGPLDSDGDGHTRVKPDLMADGVVVRSTVPFGYVYANMLGTSMSAPAVTGAVAALLDHYSDSAAWLTDWPETVKAILLASATDLDDDPSLVGRGLVNAYHAAFADGGPDSHGDFWGNALTSTGQSVQFTFDVPQGYNDVRLALTWADPAGGVEVANDLDLYVYKNATCTGTPIAASATLDDVVEFVTVAAGQPGGTWCAEVTGASLSSPQTFGLAAFPSLGAPALSVATQVDDDTPAPGQTFYLYTTLTNSGSSAPGGYASLAVPAGFNVQAARIYTADGRSLEYAASDLYFDSGAWHVAVGQVMQGFPRLVRWAVQVDPATPPGAYAVDVDADCHCDGPQASGASANNMMVFVGGYNVYVPLATQ